jgi:hypothetical protein
MEAPLYGLNEETQTLTMTREPYRKTTTRGIVGPLSSVMIWDREENRVLPGYEQCELE